jgi:hypothetical protein
MKKFIITVAEHHSVRYECEADSEEAARDAFLSGTVNDSNELDREIVASDIVLVEESED